MMSKRIYLAALIAVLSLPGSVGGTNPTVTASTSAFPVAPLDGACVDDSTACRQAISPQPAAWEMELQKAQTAWGACQKEVDRFCEGVQVGEGRIENCLKAHRAQLSRKCRKAQRL